MQRREAKQISSYQESRSGCSFEKAASSVRKVLVETREGSWARTDRRILAGDGGGKSFGQHTVSDEGPMAIHSFDRC